MTHERHVGPGPARPRARAQRSDITTTPAVPAAVHGTGERAVLVGVRLGSAPHAEVDEHLEELSRLLEAAEGTEVGRLVVERTRPDAATFIGRGRVEALRDQVRRAGAELVVFDDDLSPAQCHKIEQCTGVRAVDRSALILDIFARRARTREARIQVELAQMRYLLPRLTRRWSHLSRQVGGIGTRGVGETQLETDRRLVRRRISGLQRQLKRIDRARAERRKRRAETFQVALVGYTNAGKTTLLNALCSAQGFAEDRLFATLDPLVRKLTGAGPVPILVIDTVGFVRKLPHALVASFRSTLQEAASADMLLHVVDLSHPDHKAQADTTGQVLAELGLGDRLSVTVFNKTDRVASSARDRAERLHPDGRFVSAVAGEGLEGLRAEMRSAAASWVARRGLRAPEPWPGPDTLPEAPPRGAAGRGAG